MRGAYARRSLASAAGVEPHAQFRNAQLAMGERPLWVLTSERSLCIAQPKAASCTAKRRASREGVFLGTFRIPTKRYPSPHNFLLQGLTPDGVDGVLVIVGESRRLVVDVKDNVFAIERDQPVHRLKLLRRN